MTRLIAIALLLISCSLPALAMPEGDLRQIRIESRNPINENWKALLMNKQALRDDDLANELAVDLVDVYLTDSIMKKKMERHRFIGGGVIRAMGLGWRKVTGKKEKFVGTVKNFSGTRSKALFTEFDINYNLIPQQKKYRDLLMIAYEQQEQIGKKAKKKDYSKPPFVPPTGPEDYKRYQAHIELTPPIAYRQMINERFYPVLYEKRPKNHPAMGESNPTMGCYGAFCLDCNHTCHPEIHPYEWLWWLNLNPELDGDGIEHRWMIGLMLESSNRFQHWTNSPLTGAVSVPFIFPDSCREFRIRMDHLVFSHTYPEELHKLHLPEDYYKLNFRENRFGLEGMNGTEIVVENAFPLVEKGIVYWLDELNHDSEGGWISGKFHLGLSSKEIHLLQIEMDY